MSFNRDKYRNPPPPPGYVQIGEPTLKLKKAAYEKDPMYILMQELLDAKVYDIPDITIYEEFKINPDSDDEIMPAVPAPEVVDTSDIAAEKEPNIVPLINTKKEECVSPAKESEAQQQKKKYKRKRIHSRRWSKQKQGSSSYSSDRESLSDDSDSKKSPVGDRSDGRSPTKKKDDYVGERKSCIESHPKKNDNSD